MPGKKDVLLALLERSSVFVHLDPRPESVRVPPWFKKQPQLVLQIGLNLAVPIRDLNVDDEAVSGTLSFSRSPHFCYMPWSAVFALVGEDNRGMVWPENIPPEVVAQRAKSQQSASDKPKLRAVGQSSGGQAGRKPKEERTSQEHGKPKASTNPPAAETQATPAKPSSGPPSGKPRPSHLRLVK